MQTSMTLLCDECKKNLGVDTVEISKCNWKMLCKECLKKRENEDESKRQ